MKSNKLPERSNVQGKVSISDLYPGIPPEQRNDAEYRLLGYVAIVKRIFKRVCRERGRILTDLERRATLRKQGGVKDTRS